MDVATAYLDDVRLQFRKLKKLAEDAVAQVPDDELVVALDVESNSLAVIMKHVAGNLRSRFTDFLTTDGEKPDRNRDGEFEIDGNPGRAAIMADWESGWARLFADPRRPGSGRSSKGGPGPRRSPFGPVAARPADDPPRLPCWPDRLHGQALTVG